MINYGLLLVCLVPFGCKRAADLTPPVDDKRTSSRLAALAREDVPAAIENTNQVLFTDTEVVERAPAGVTSMHLRTERGADGRLAIVAECTAIAECGPFFSFERKGATLSINHRHHCGTVPSHTFVMDKFTRVLEPREEAEVTRIEFLHLSIAKPSIR